MSAGHQTVQNHLEPAVGARNDANIKEVAIMRGYKQAWARIRSDHHGDRVHVYRDPIWIDDN